MRYSRSLSAYLTALLLALLAPVALHAADEPAAEEKAKKAEPVVKLLEAGDEPRQQLRFKPEKGAKEETEMRMRMKMQQSMNGMQMPPTQMPMMRLLMTTTVEEVKDNGDATYTTSITKAEVRDEPGVNPMVRRQISEVLRAMEGTVVRATFTGRGIPKDADMDLPEGADPATRQQMEGMMGSMDQFAVPVPEEAVGVGAKWQVETTMTQQGMTIRQAAVYTLKSIDGDEILLDLELTQTADPQDIEGAGVPPGATVRLESLEGEGSGESTFRLSGLMPRSARMQSATDYEMAMTMGGHAQKMSRRLEMDTRMARVETKEGDE